MHTYELGIIIRPTLDEETLKAEYDMVLDLISRFGGVVDKVDPWGKRKLAYEIQKFTEGVYYFITINAPPTMPREIEDRLRIRENILRYLMIRKDA